MDVSVFLPGAVIGFSVAAPVGPIGVLCIRRSLGEGSRAGLCCGLGAATADAMYGAVAAFGLTAISDVLIAGQLWTRLIGGLFLLYLGLRTLRSPVVTDTSTPARTRLLATYGQTLVLTLTNPTTVLSFAAIFAGLGFAATTGRDPATAGLLVVGVFAGSSLWWLILSTVVGRSRRLLPRSTILWINRVSALIIGGFGVVLLLSLAG